ncbi:hypothetical protein ACWDZ4_31355 [Streptomyces sp. NPDC003016]
MLPRARGEAGRKGAAGDPVLSPSAIRQLITTVTAESDTDERRRVARERLAVLGAWKHEVALTVGRGLADVEAAAELSTDVPTVKTHVSSILTKFGLDNRAQIALLRHDAGER